MRKIIYLFLLFFAFQSSLTYAAKDCVDLEKQYNTLKEKVVYEMDQWKNIPKNDAKKATQGKVLSDLLAQGVKIENDYNDCLGSVKKINELIETYFTLGDRYFAHKQWDKAIEQYKEIIKLDSSSYQANYNIGSCYLNKGDLNNSLAYYQHAQYSAR
jgi:tetratricopeptide (TPR) repeat protein